MSKYRISVASSPGWREKDICSLEISMGNPKHEGIKLQSLLMWANENFKHCIINVGDTLQRHNLILDGMNEDEAYETSLSMGNEWFERNQRYFDVLRIPFTTYRWDDWLKSEDFDTLHKNIWLYYNNNKTFRDCVNEDAMFFVNKREDMLDKYGMERLKASSINFLIEEAAGDTILSRKLDIARVYPATQFNAFKHLSRPETPKAVAGLGRDVYTRVNFKKKKAA